MKLWNHRRMLDVEDYCLLIVLDQSMVLIWQDGVDYMLSHGLY